MKSAELCHISSDATLTFLHNCPKLHAACAKLKVEVGNKELDLVTWQQI